MGGVLVIVLVLIAIPDHHKSLSFVFTDTENFSGYQGHGFGNPVFWIVFGLGLLMVEGNPVTQRALLDRGCEVHTFPGTEVCINGSGGPTCITRPILRG